MSTPSATFAVNLKDGTSGPARSASSAVKALRAEMERETKTLRGAEAAMKRLNTGAQVNVATQRRLQSVINASKAAVSGAQQKILDLGGALAETKPPTGAFAAFIAQARAAPGALGPLGSGLEKLRAIGPAAVLGVGMVGVLVALTAAAVAGAVALGRLTAEIVRYGLASADARRNETLHLEGLTRVRTHSMFASMSSGELVSSIDRVSNVAAIGRSEVARYAETLYRMGVRGSNHAAALEAVSIAAAAGGDEVGRRYLGLAAGAARLGRSVRAVTDDARARFGAVNARMNLSLGRQADRLSQSFADLFGGARVSAALERFLERVNQIQSLFSQSSASGRALRQIVEAIFPNTLDTVTDLLPLVRRLFQRMVIGGLEAAIALVVVRRELRSVWDEAAGGLRFIDGVSAALNGISIAFRSPLAWFAMVGRTAYLWWHDLGATAASRLVEGLTGGLRDRTADVTASVSGLARDVARSFAEELGIRSPSRVFMEFGHDVAAGLTAGVDAGAPSATAAVNELVAVPEGGGIASSAPGASISIGEVHVHTSATDARGIALDIRDQLAEVLSGLALERGATPA